MIKQELIKMSGIEKEVTVIDRAGLQVGQIISGPALVTETSATTWLAEGWRAEIDEVGNLKLVKDL